MTHKTKGNWMEGVREAAILGLIPLGLPLGVSWGSGLLSWVSVEGILLEWCLRRRLVMLQVGNSVRDYFTQIRAEHGGGSWWQGSLPGPCVYFWKSRRVLGTRLCCGQQVSSFSCCRLCVALPRLEGVTRGTQNPQGSSCSSWDTVDLISWKVHFPWDVLPQIVPWIMCLQVDFVGENGEGGRERTNFI